MVPLETLRHMLLARRRLLLERVARTMDDLRWLDTNLENETIEEGQEGALARLLVRLEDRDRAELEDIVAALGRIANADYGWCEECRQPIAVERLWVMPETRSCHDCAAEAELQSGKHPRAAVRAGRRSLARSG